MLHIDTGISFQEDIDERIGASRKSLKTDNHSP
jgi:hypothetical protein